MRYDVHLYPEVRVKVSSIEAGSPQEAIEKAYAAVDLDQLGRARVDGASEVECVEEAGRYALVDLEGDREHDQSCWYHSVDGRWVEGTDRAAVALSKRETATVLAALRVFQSGRPVNLAEHFAGCEPLSPEEIDALCERLNCGTGEPEPDAGAGPGA